MITEPSVLGRAPCIAIVSDQWFSMLAFILYHVQDGLKTADPFSSAFSTLASVWPGWHLLFRVSSWPLLTTHLSSGPTQCDNQTCLRTLQTTGLKWRESCQTSENAKVQHLEMRNLSLLKELGDTVHIKKIKMGLERWLHH